MSIWKEKQTKKKEETRMTGIFIDLDTAKKLAQNMKQISKVFKELEEKQNVNKK